MNVFQPDRPPQKSRARDRVTARRQKAMATPRPPLANPPIPGMGGNSSAPRTGHTPGGLPVDYAQREYAPGEYAPRPTSAPSPRAARRRMERQPISVDWGVGAQPSTARGLAKVHLAAADVLWQARHDVRIPLAIVGALVASMLLFIGFHVVGGRVFPNVWALGVNLGGRTNAEAITALETEWSQLTLTLHDDERTWTLTPGELGIRLNAEETVNAARGAGLSGLPFGTAVLPTVEIDELRAQSRLLDMTPITGIDPYNAGYRWEADQLVGVPGSPGRYLDVTTTLAALTDALPRVMEARRLALAMTSIDPDILDPTPFLAQAQTLVTQPFNLYGYDPFTDERVLWRTDRDTFTSWIEAGANGLTLREEAFAPFLDLQTQSLEASNPLRYLEPSDAVDKVRVAIEAGHTDVSLRVRYRTSTYAVQSGDTGYGMARRLGVPFLLIQQANPGRDWDSMLVPGELINMPSPDAVVALDPIPQQRIVIDLDTQYLWAFENGQIVYQWAISSGMNHAPTSPGIYQVLSHEEQATGSSIELCGNNSCGTWEMYWFMGIYEVFPGLVNGFHGAVLLPNGAYLGGGNVGAPFTYGCIMSENSNAEALFRWAQEGAMVEIVSSEYAPRSLLAQTVVAQARMERQHMLVQGSQHDPAA